MRTVKEGGDIVHAERCARIAGQKEREGRLSPKTVQTILDLTSFIAGEDPIIKSHMRGFSEGKRRPS